MPVTDYLDAQQLIRTLPWTALIDALERVFTIDVVEPVRHHHTLRVPGEPDATLLLMPAWIEGAYLGVKQVSVFPGNSQRNQAALSSSYLLSCARTGKPLLQLDADVLTAHRTAAASALASRYLSRPDAHTLLVMGAGRMARALIDAHRAVRPIDRVLVWNRREEGAGHLVRSLEQQGIAATVCPQAQLPDWVARADIISCATMATEPILRGEWLQAGVHIDLVGAFRPDMRETDDEVIRRASVFVDTRAGALAEAGDLLQAEATGVFRAADVVAEFTELCSGRHAGRQALSRSVEQITLFKSVGAAREDLAAAILAHENHQPE